MHHNGPDVFLQSVGVPEAVENLAAGKYPVGILDEEYKHLEFLGGQVYRSISYCDGMSRQINGYFACRQ